MPIGVPRIIYCWGEELPAQWTDIYNFIFRRRMVFLMQYLDDELCNQICGLLINIHMEDRENELSKKEMESGTGSQKTRMSRNDQQDERKTTKAMKTKESSFYNKKNRSVEDLLNADEDLGIDSIYTLEQYTLQKITTEWLNWNAQFFDYSDEPYLFYLAELLEKDATALNGLGNGDQQAPYGNGNNVNVSQLLNMFRQNGTNGNGMDNNGGKLDAYSAFRKYSKGGALNKDLRFKDSFSLSGKQKLLQMFKNKISSEVLSLNNSNGGLSQNQSLKNREIYNLLSECNPKDFSQYYANETNLMQSSEKALGQRHLRREYNRDNSLVSNSEHMRSYNQKAWRHAVSSLMGDNSLNSEFNSSSSEFRDYYRKQTERTLIDEESKKVFVIINSFGGSVGNGITVHDALQFIKAGSLTLALGVAASAASLALAGGTIGERYVTEGCHVMIHQPEGQLQGQASDIWIDSQEIRKIRLDVAEIYSLSTYRPRHKILRDLDRDFYLTATETISYGLADEIATNEVMHSIIEMTNQVWNYHDTKQQSLLETRERSFQGGERTQESTGG